jgi:Anti-sigma factor NepR
MAVYNFYSHDRTRWLLEIGRRLQAQYDEIAAAPVPEPIADLLKQVETSADAHGDAKRVA